MRHGYKNKSPDKRKEKEQEDAENLRQKKWAVSLLYENAIRGQFNKEIQVYFTSGTLVFTNSHQFESTKSLYKFPLEASNLYLQWYSIGFNQLPVENLHLHSALIKKTTLVVSLLNWPQKIFNMHCSITQGKKTWSMLLYQTSSKQTNVVQEQGD